MNTVYVAIAVDTVGALSAGTLEGFVYMADTNQYLGSWQQGTSKLHTVCQDGQRITWSAASIDPGDAVTISGFSGAMVSRKVCVPKADITQGDGVFVGRVETRGGFGGFAYTVTLEMEGKTLSLDAEIKIV